MFITAFNVEKAQCFIMELRDKLADSCLKRFEYDFEEIASNLRIRENGKKLVLLDRIDVLALREFGMNGDSISRNDDLLENNRFDT